MLAMGPSILGLCVLALALLTLSSPADAVAFSAESKGRPHKKDARVLILGGGVTGVIAARTLHEKGISNFTIVEARGMWFGRKTRSFHPYVCIWIL